MQPRELVHGQRQHTEHELGHDLLCASYPDLDRLGVIGGIYHIVEEGDAIGSHLYQRNRDLGIRHAGHIEMQLVAAPPFRLSIVALLAAEIAGGGDTLQHLLHGGGP